jgi:UTP:GlnB (protein PII) uridylyltransferase
VGRNLEVREIMRKEIDLTPEQLAALEALFHDLGIKGQRGRCLQAGLRTLATIATNDRERRILAYLIKYHLM